MRSCYLTICFLFLCASLAAQVTSTANSDSGSGYPALLSSGFEIEDPDCVHQAFGPHVTQAADAELDRNVFVFHSHIEEDNDRCQVFDRVRMEIKGSGNSDLELQHPRGEETFYRWKFRLDENFIGASSFTHLFQNKAVGGDDTSFPILTITARANKVEVKHDGGDTGSDLGTLAEAPLNRFQGRWVEGYIRQVHDENGELEITIKDMRTGLTILEYTNLNIDLWRLNATFNRPKWGVYRSKNTSLRDEEVRFANFCVSESAESFCPGEAVLQPDTEAPSAPTALAVTGTTFTTVSLDWDASEDEFGVTGYRVFSGNDLLASVAEDEATISDLATATSYTFTVRAIDAAGNVSEASNSVIAVTDDANALPDVATSPSPRDGTENVNPQSGLGWAAGDNTTDFEVFFGTETDPPSVSTQTTTSYQPVMEANMTYYWRVEARNTNGATSSPTWSFTTGDANDDFPWNVFRGNARLDVETNFWELNTRPDNPPLDAAMPDPDNPGNSLYSFQSTEGDNFRWRYGLDGGDSTITIVTRIMGIGADNGLMHIEVRAFGWRQKVRINNSSIKLERASPVVERDLDFNLDQEFHVVRLVASGQTVTVYVDENPEPFLVGQSGETSATSYIEIGKSGGSDYGATYDWIAVNTNERSAPAEGTALPADLILNNDGPWDTFRGTARPEVENPLFELNTAPDVPLVDTIVLDPNGSGNTYYGFRTDDGNFRWRYDLANEDSTITVVARLKAIDPEVDGVIYFEFRAFGWRQKIRINQSSIKLERTDDGVEADTPFNWNDELHVVRFTIAGPTVNVYLDESPEVFLTGESNEETGSTYFEWGKSGGSDYGAFVDWLVVDVASANAPGEGPALPDDLFLSSDATLASLTIGGVEVDTFSPYQTEYTFDVAGDEAPAIEFTTSSDFAVASVITPTTLPDTAFITVAAGDGFTSRTYAIIFTTSVSTFDPLLQSALTAYPNPATDHITIGLPEVDRYQARIFGLDGRAVGNPFPIRNGQSVDVSRMRKGAYILLVRSDAGRVARLKLLID